ncbi:uncharacterized protein LW94_6800 [Fusarium fujikuroi]|nr:uncharacterized protein LW94_6800 [Fusarium fujikuroi]SCO10214.1 uncharacterized protein FFE2_12026 [Fusarium fujikuroi]SCO56321.1 uncharacterized protein FFMR_13477 [Fusarium fujikuroi]SCV56038.1 uncharacterized protein FFFS_12039 [Fusarium fujikuroi]
MGDLNSSNFTQPGTFDILESCIFTLIACIFTALHLDVVSNPTWQRLLFEKAKWVLLTIVIPEISILTATRQFMEAWELRSDLQKMWKQQKPSRSSPEDGFKINTKYAYFIIMGGLRFDVSDILSLRDIDPSAKKLFNGPKNGRKTVRAGPGAILLLAREGHWIKIQQNEIDDKSKANIFQKALVLIQVLWMCMQCFWRGAYGFPITLLEFHTMLHVAFAVFQYCLWIKKPLDIQEAIVVQSHGLEAEIAIMLQRQFYSRMSYRLALFKSRQTPEQPPPLGPSGRQMRWIDQIAPTEMKVGDILTSGLALYRIDVTSGYFPLENIWGPMTVIKHKIKSKDSPDFCFDLTPEFLRRWNAILSRFPDEQRENLAKTMGYNQIWRSDVEAGIPDLPEREKRILLLTRLVEFRHEPLLDREREFWEGRSIFSLDIAPHFETQGFRETYGPIWKFWRAIVQVTFAHRGSLMEGLIWLTIWCLFLNESYVLVFPHKTPEFLKKAIRQLAKFYCIYLLSVLGVAYILSGAFIVAEIFASLRYCPVGVFITFQWLELFPHF